MRSRHGSALLALIAVCATVPAAAAAAAPAAASLERVGAVRSIAVSDHERRVAYELARGRRVAVVDSPTGRRTVVRRPPKCRLLALNGPRLHFECPSRLGSPEERVLSATTGRTLRLRGVRVLNQRLAACEADPECSARVEIRGEHWIGVAWTDHGENPTLVTVDYTNVASGRVLPRSQSATALDDPDFRRLHRPLCAPMRRTPVEGGYPFDPPFQPFAYARPWGLSAVPDRFDLLRCGRSRPVLTVRGGRALVLEAGHLAWLTADPGPTRRRLHVRDLATGRRASWLVDKYLGRLTIPAFTLTRDRLYLLDFSRGAEGRYVLYRARLP